MGLCYRTDKTTLSHARHQEFGYPMTGLFQNNINFNLRNLNSVGKNDTEYKSSPQ